LLPEEAFERLKQWNAKNAPPLDEKALKTKIKQAYSKKYTVGFRSIIKENVLRIFCPPDCDACRYSPQSKELSEIKLVYAGGRKWKIHGPHEQPLLAPIPSGAALLSSKCHGKSKLFEFASMIDATYSNEGEPEHPEKLPRECLNPEARGIPVSEEEWEPENTPAIRILHDEVLELDREDPGSADRPML